MEEDLQTVEDRPPRTVSQRREGMNNSTDKLISYLILEKKNCYHKMNKMNISEKIWKQIYFTITIIDL